MIEVGVGAVVSVLTGVALWAVLPRGVVLTREQLTQGYDGKPLYNTWRIRNDSALPVRFTGVTYTGVNTFNPATDQIEVLDLPSWVPAEQEADLGISLSLDDEVAELTRDADELRWDEVVVPPGDTLTAYVNLNRTLSIQYRRAGRLGLFERRTLRIDGGV